MNGSQYLETIHHGHIDVRNQAIDLRQTTAFQQCGCRRKQAHCIVRRLQEKLNRLENSLIIINHCDDEVARVVSHGILVWKPIAAWAREFRHGQVWTAPTNPGKPHFAEARCGRIYWKDVIARTSSIERICAQGRRDFESGPG